MHSILRQYFIYITNKYNIHHDSCQYWYTTCIQGEPPPVHSEVVIKQVCEILRSETVLPVISEDTSHKLLPQVHLLVLQSTNNSQHVISRANP